MKDHPEFPKTPPESDIPGSVTVESEIPGSVPLESEIPVAVPSEFEIPGSQQPEFEIPGSVPPEFEIPGTVPVKTQYNMPMKKTSIYLNKGEKKENKSMNFIQRQNIKKDILEKLNRKMKVDVSLTKEETTLTFHDTNQIPNGTVESESNKCSNQLTEESLVCPVTDVGMKEEHNRHQSVGSKLGESKVLPDIEIITSNKKESKRSRIPTKLGPQISEKLVKKPNLKKSNIPTRVRPIQARLKSPENPLKKSNFKKSKIPTKVIQVRSKSPEKTSKKIIFTKSKIPIKRSSPLAGMILNDTGFKEIGIPIKIQTPERLLEKSQLPVVVKESDSTVTIAALVEVKVSRLPQKLRALFQKFRRPSGKKSKKIHFKRKKKVRFSLPIDDIYRKALSGDDGIKSRLPMPIRVTHPGRLNPPISRIPLAFSRFPNPAKARKTTLLRRVKKAFIKQVAQINWNPKLNFPNMEAFFHRIRGSNKVMPVIA